MDAESCGKLLYGIRFRDTRQQAGLDISERPEAVIFQLKNPIRVVEGGMDGSHGRQGRFFEIGAARRSR